MIAEVFEVMQQRPQLRRPPGRLADRDRRCCLRLQVPHGHGSEDLPGETSRLLHTAEHVVAARAVMVKLRIAHTAARDPANRLTNPIPLPAAHESRMPAPSTEDARDARGP